MWCSQELGADVPFPSAVEVEGFPVSSGKQEPLKSFSAQQMHQ